MLFFLLLTLSFVYSQHIPSPENWDGETCQCLNCETEDDLIGVYQCAPATTACNAEAKESYSFPCYTDTDLPCDCFKKETYPCTMVEETEKLTPKYSAQRYVGAAVMHHVDYQACAESCLILVDCFRTTYSVVEENGVTYIDCIHYSEAPRNQWFEKTEDTFTSWRKVCAEDCEEGYFFSGTGLTAIGEEGGCQPCSSCSTTEKSACTSYSDTQCAAPCEEGLTFSSTGDDSAEACQPCTDTETCTYGIKETCTTTSDAVCVTCDEHVESQNTQIESLKTQYADAQAKFEANMKAAYETKYNQLNPFDVLNEPVHVALLALSVLGVFSIGYALGYKKSNYWAPIPEV